MGVAYEHFMDSCPKELEPYVKAHNNKIMEEDYLQHLWWGNYGISALIVAIDRSLHGKKAKAKYIDKPILQEIEKMNQQLSEDEIKKQRELFVAKLEIMKTNFELSKKGQ